MNVTKTLNRTVPAVIVGSLLFAAVPFITHPASATAAAGVTASAPSVKAAKTAPSATASRISGNRVKVTVKTRAKKIVVKYKAGKTKTAKVRSKRGLARTTLPSNTTKVVVRAPGTRWTSVGIPRKTGNPGGGGGGSNGSAGGNGGSGWVEKYTPDALLNTTAPLTLAEANSIRGRLEKVVQDFQSQARTCEANYFYPETRAFGARTPSPVTPQLNAKADAGIRRNNWLDWTASGELMTADSWASIASGDIAAYELNTFGAVVSVDEFRDRLEDGMTCRALMIPSGNSMESFTIGVMRTDHAPGNPYVTGTKPVFGIAIYSSWTYK